MKKIYLFLLVLSSLSAMLQAQAKRKVLVEEFTQASCGPCAATNPGFHKILFTPGNDTKITLLKYQTSWPGTDPMNTQNPTEVATRVTYYGVNSVPHGVEDGGATETNAVIFKDHPANFSQANIDSRAAVTSPLEIKVDHVVADKLDSVQITVNVKNVSANNLADLYTLHVILIEKEINFSIPPGTNGETQFHSVMRKMIPNASGTKLGALDAGASKDFSFKIAIPSYIYNYRNLGVVTFVQNTTKKEVLQSEESLPKPLPTNSTYIDIKASSSVTGYSGLCDNNVGLLVNFENLGKDSIRTISIDLLVNNIKKTGQTALQLDLPPGGTGTYEFKNVNVSPGKSNLNFRINNVNGSTKDIDKLNHAGPNRVVFNVDPVPFTKELTQGFEVNATGAFPKNVYADNNSSMRVYPAQKSFFGTSFDVGGFGNSVYALFWDWYFGPVNTEVTVFFDKIDLSTSTNTTLSLDRAYAQLGAEASYFQIEASKDCGANWTTVYQKNGAELATAGPVPGTYFIPDPSQWVRDSVSMKDFDGASEVIVRMKGFNSPGGSNLLFIDNINIGSVVVATDNPGVITSTNVYPNPVTEHFSLRINVEEAVSGSLELVDLQGRTVRSFDRQLHLKQGITNVSYPVSGIQPGFYNLRLQTEKGTKNMKFQIL